MSLYINTKLVGVTLFMIVFIYFSAFIVFGDETSNAYFSRSSTDFLPMTRNYDNGTTNVSYYSFESWLNIQYEIAIDSIANGKEYQDNYYDYKSFGATNDDAIAIMEDKVTEWPLLQAPRLNTDYINKYPDGVSAYYKDDFDAYDKEVLLNKYGDYESSVMSGTINSLSYEKRNSFNGLTSIVGILTFDFKDSYGTETIDDTTRLVLNVFMIPLYLVLLISFLPLMVFIIEAFTSGSLVIAIIKGLSLALIAGGLVMYFM